MSTTHTRNMKLKLHLKVVKLDTSFFSRYVFCYSSTHGSIIIVAFMSDATNGRDLIVAPHFL